MQKTQRKALILPKHFSENKKTPLTTIKVDKGVFYYDFCFDFAVSVVDAYDFNSVS